MIFLADFGNRFFYFLLWSYSSSSIFSTFYHAGGEFSSAFSKSVKVHVASLVRAGKTVHAPYLQEDSDREKEIEREVMSIIIIIIIIIIAIIIIIIIIIIYYYYLS